MSVGHVQRAVEAVGIPTVGVYISAFAHVPSQMRLSRALITPNPLGRPLGAPHDLDRQRDVVAAALGLIAADEPVIHHYPAPYRRAPAPTTDPD